MPRKKEKPNHGSYYECKITIGHDLSGNPIRKSFLSKKSKADAKRMAEEYKVQMKASMMVGEPFADGSMSLSDWADQWLQLYKAGKEDATYLTYERPIRLQIKPYFGDTKLRDIYPASIQAFYNQLPEGKSQSWYQKVYLTLSALLSSAVENDLIAKSPHRNIVVPTGQPTKNKRTYSQNERDKLFEAALTSERGMPIALLLELGLRREELLALQWEHIDLLHRTVKIQQAIKVTKNGGVIIGATKNKSSVRELPLSDDLSKYLTKYQRESGFVVHAPLGGVYAPMNWMQRYYEPYMEQVCQGLKVPVLNPHELRHTCGTLLYNRTHDIYAVSKFLGHASTQITAQVYVHNNVESLRSIVYPSAPDAGDKKVQVSQSV